uniref:Sulfotransferase domain-containing protein n=1 Tax=Emiliania huxleyi TaxID=2903 RepID=A0A7S3W671_EMIHU
MPPGDLLPSPEVLCDNRAVPAGAQPMILWQAQRVGSTWVEGLLNSHPEIEMQSEIYNYCPDAACLQRMCGLFTKPQHAADRVRGFKQKFFYCGGSLQKNWKVCLPADAGLNALERCLLPNDPEVSTRDNIKTIIRRHQHSLSHQIFTHVGAKIVCMLRRNAFDIALSMRTHNILSQRCSISNIVDAEALACWQEVRRGGVWINATEFGKTVAAQTRFTRFQVEICEAQARLSPVYFLWYEDLLNNFQKSTRDLQTFLNVTPLELTATAQRVNADARTWVVNFDELVTAAEEHLTMLESSSEDCNGVLGAHGMLRNSSSILATADSAVGEAEVEGYHSTQALLLLAAAAAGSAFTCVAIALAAGSTFAIRALKAVARPAPIERGSVRSTRGKRLPRRAAPQANAWEYAPAEQSVLITGSESRTVGQQFRR